MIVDCERCPGQHLSPPACPTCVVQLLLQPTGGRPAGPAPGRGRLGPPDVVRAPDSRPVEVELLRRVDDLGRPLDAREQRAVAVLTAAGLLVAPGPGGHGADDALRAARSGASGVASTPSGATARGTARRGVRFRTA